MAYSIIHQGPEYLDNYVENTGLRGLQDLAEGLKTVSTLYKVVWNSNGCIEPLDSLERIELWNLIKRARRKDLEPKPKCKKCSESLQEFDGLQFCVNC